MLAKFRVVGVQNFSRWDAGGATTGLTRHIPRMFSASRCLHRRTWVLTILPRNLQRLSRNATFLAPCLPQHQGTKNSVMQSCRSLSTKPPSPSPEPQRMSIHAHTRFEEDNSSYVAKFKDRGKLAIPPAKHLAIVTCMDARIE